MTNRIFWKRVYEDAKAEDGFRILIDRLWPRGLTKRTASLGAWAKEIAPSTELRQAYHRGEIAYPQFAAMYKTELEENPAFKNFADAVENHLKEESVTLVYASKEPEKSHIPILKEFLIAALNK
ncbi:MAG: DUF488 domain-containing protein [Treponema sp.]